MILYFSGTGNSEAVARHLGALLEEEVLKLTDHSPDQIKFTGDNLAFVFPVYSWGVAPLILEYVRQINRTFIDSLQGKKIWAILCCGDDTGRAPEMFEKALHEVDLKLSGVWSVQMPNNYVLLPRFNVDTKEIEDQKLSEFPERVKKIAECIISGKEERDYVAGSFPGLKTGLVYPLFKHFGVFPSRWYSTEACVGCKKCAEVCPVNNITMSGKRPNWGKNCVSCLGCYHVCPRNAVQYGKATSGKGQYWYHAIKRK